MNSIYDTLGFISPFTIQGKICLRQLTSENRDWDIPLPREKQQIWELWKKPLKTIEQLQILLSYISATLMNSTRKEIHVFSDASIKTRAVVAYLKVKYPRDMVSISFVLKKAKLTPKSAHTFPSFELCAAELAVEIAELIKREIDFKIGSLHFYTHNNIVLGYIHNQIKQFYGYVGNRVEHIIKFSNPDQWHYVPRNLSPNDAAPLQYQPLHFWTFHGHLHLTS